MHSHSLDFITKLLAVITILFLLPTSAIASTPSITSPPPTSTLSGYSETFHWDSNGTHSIVFYIGSTLGGTEYGIDSMSLGQVFINNIPMDGNTIYVRLWYKETNNSDYLYIDTTYTALTAPAMLSPAPTTSLTGSDQIFEWDTFGSNIESYTLIVTDSTPVYPNSSATSALVTSIPIDGRSLNARLWFTIAGHTSHVDTAYYASSSITPLSITSPTQNSTLTTSSQLFTWNENDENVESWVILAGSALGLYDYFVGTGSSNETSINITNLPIDSSSIHIRFWYETASGWEKLDSSYTAANTNSLPQVTTPLGGSVLNGSNHLFTWNANAANVQAWALYAGDTLGAYNYYFYSGSATHTTVTGLPTDESTVYFRLWYKVDGNWSSQDLTYMAASPIIPPTVEYPAPGSTLESPNQLINWNTNNEPISAWALYAGSTLGNYDYYFYSGSATNTVITGLPTDGSTIYIRLWYQIAGRWYIEDLTYTAATISSAPLQILQLGDSITQAHVSKLSYRYHLWKLLIDQDISFDFIGNETMRYGSGNAAPWPDYLGQPFDLDHEGHSGWRADEILNDLGLWLNDYTPDVALVHLGTNDIFQDEDTASSLADLTEIINVLRIDNPNISIFLAKLIPTTWNTINGESANIGVNNLNTELDNLANNLTTTDSPIIIVNMNAAFPFSYLYDGTHPNIDGDIEISQRWFNAMSSNGIFADNN